MNIALLAATIAAAHATGSPSALPDCLGKPVVKPAAITLTCADAGFAVHGAQWTGWGSTFAAARGTETVNDCKPNCAAGHFHNYAVVLIASGSQRCSTSVTAYTTVTVAFVVKNPTISATPSSWTFRCR